MTYLTSNDRMDQYKIATVLQAPSIPIPPDKRVPHGWDALAIAPPGSNEPTILKWTDLEVSGVCRFRVATAIDVREEKLIEAFLPSSGRTIGTLDIRYSSVYLPSEIVISPEDAQAVAKEGLGLRMIKGEQPYWALSGFEANGYDHLPLLPHLLIENSIQSAPIDQFVKRMASLASLQQFGWMEGCVLDGLYDLEGLYGTETIRPAIEKHMHSFLDPDGNLRYENPRSEPADGRIYSSEMATLPFAVMARIWPDHPSIDVAIKWWLDTVQKPGGVKSHRTLTAEGSYIVAYPMAVVATVRGREDLADLAVEHLLARQERLFTGDALYQQRRTDGGYAFRNWARGCAWYILGLTRSLIELGDFPSRASLEQELHRVAEWLLSFQHDDGLWSCYVDEPETGKETSGSAGIAAALAKGFVHGLLPESAFQSAVRTLQSLEDYLTPDGFLDGVCQMNKGGDPLQRGGYRVLSQMGMGLKAILFATVKQQSLDGNR